MKFNISKKELWEIREIIYKGKQQLRIYTDRIQNEINSEAEFQNKMIQISNKLIRKLNICLKEKYGHDCYGDNYLK